MINCRSQISAGKNTVKTLHFWSSKNIFKKTEVPILSEEGVSQKGRLRWATRSPHHTWARQGISRRPSMVSSPRAPPRDALWTIYCPDLKLTKQLTISPEEFQTSTAIQNPNSGDRSLCFGTLPGRGIAPGAISIDATASIIVVTASHDEEGVVLHRG